MLVGLLGATPLPSLAVERSCQSVGRIMASSSPSWKPGQLLCAGDPPPTAKLTIFCATTGQVQETQPGLRLEAQGCLIGLAAEIRCGEILCKRPKGGLDQTLTLTTPLGTSLLSSPTQFSWLPSAAAQSYLVQVEGQRMQWQRTATRANLAYPADVAPMQPGQTYRITVIAVDAQGTPLTGKTKTLAIISQPQSEQIQAIAQQLQALPVDRDELAAIDLRSLYLANGLTEEAIAVLEKQVAAGTQNPVVYQALGQTYARVRNAPKATAAYQRAIDLAQAKGQMEAQKQLEAELKQLIVAWQSEPASRE